MTTLAFIILGSLLFLCGCFAYDRWEAARHWRRQAEAWAAQARRSDVLLRKAVKDLREVLGKRKGENGE